LDSDFSLVAFFEFGVFFFFFQKKPLYNSHWGFFSCRDSAKIRHPNKKKKRKKREKKFAWNQGCGDHP
jgi:hypothetical protein